MAHDIDAEPGGDWHEALAPEREAEAHPAQEKTACPGGFVPAMVGVGVGTIVGETIWWVLMILPAWERSCNAGKFSPAKNLS